MQVRCQEPLQALRGSRNRLIPAMFESGPQVERPRGESPHYWRLMGFPVETMKDSRAQGYHRYQADTGEDEARRHRAKSHPGRSWLRIKVNYLSFASLHAWKDHSQRASDQVARQSQKTTAAQSVEPCLVSKV